MTDEGRADLIKWWDALDALTGNSNTVPSVVTGLRLARESHHPDAVWLCSLFPDRVVSTEELLHVMEAQGSDPRSLYIRGEEKNDLGLVREAAERDYAPAQAALALRGSGTEGLRWAQLSASQGYREGLRLLGRYLWTQWETKGCESDRAQAVALYRQAAELGTGQYVAGLRTWSADDWQRYRLWGPAAIRGEAPAIFDMVRAASVQLQKWEQGIGSARIVFELGAAFKGQVDVPQETVFCFRCAYEQVQAAQRCVLLHDEWISRAKSGTETWIAVGLQLGVVKDIRAMIARLLRAQPWSWDRRKEEEL